MPTLSPESWNTPALRLEPVPVAALCLPVAALLCIALGLCWWSRLPIWACVLVTALAPLACWRELVRLNRRWGAYPVRALCFGDGGWHLELQEGGQVPVELLGQPFNGLRVKAARFRRGNGGAVFRLCLPRGSVSAEQWRRLSLALNHSGNR